MKKWKLILATAALSLCLGFACKADSKAAVTGVKQTDDSSSSVSLQCDAQLGAPYYYLELSTDKVNWVLMDVTSNPNNLYAYSLTSGRTYYARVGTCTDWDYVGNAKQIVGPIDMSPVTEVVTAPSGSVTATQANATTKSFQVAINGITGANYYSVMYNNLILAQGSSNRLTTKNILSPGCGYWVKNYAGRRSALTGYVAWGDYDYEKMQTVSGAVSTQSFGVSNAWQNINSYRFEVASGNTDVDGWQWQYVNTKGKVVRTVTGTYHYASFIQGTFYRYRVRSYVECGTKTAYGAWSAYKTIAVPKKVSAKAVGKRAIKISIGKVSGATKYDIYTSTSSRSGFKKVKTLSAKKRTFTIKKINKKKLKKGKTYYIRVIPKAKIGKKTYKANTYGSYYVTLY